MLPLENIAAGAGLFGFPDLLVDDRSTLDDFVPGGVQDEIALLIERELICALKTQPDGGGISTGSNDEVVLQLLLVAVVNQVHTGIDLPVLHTAVAGNVGAPLFGLFPMK